MDYDDDPTWACVHPVVGHLLRRYELEPHGLRGFPVLPVLTTRGSADVGIWIAERARPLVPEPDLEAYDATLDVVKALLAADRRCTELAGKGESKAEIAAIRERKVRRAALQERLRKPRPRGVSGVAYGAMSVLTAASYSTMQVLRGMITRLASALDDAQIPELAAELEDRILCAECQAAADTYVPEPVKVERVLWRGPRGTRTAGHFLFETRDGYGVITKLKRRWRGVTGDRDEVLATLPDAWFPEATEKFFELTG